jgi:hypothetical protein
MDFAVPTQGAWSLVKGRPEPLETTAGVRPLSYEERVKFARETIDRREAWRAACEAHLNDLRRAYPR